MMLMLVKPMVNVGEAQAVNRMMAVNGRGRQEVLDLGLELTGANLQEAFGVSHGNPQAANLLGASPSARTCCINPPGMI